MGEYKPNQKFYKTSLDGLLEGTLEVMRDESKFPYFSLLLGSMGVYRRIMENIRYRRSDYDHPIVKFERQQLIEEMKELIQKYLDIEPDPLTLMAGIMLTGYAERGHKVIEEKCIDNMHGSYCWVKEHSYTKEELAEKIGKVLTKYGVGLLRDKYLSRKEIENIRRNLNEIVNTIEGGEECDRDCAFSQIYRVIGLMYIEKLKKLGIAKEESGEQYKIIIDEKKLMERYKPLIQSIGLDEKLIKRFKNAIAGKYSEDPITIEEIYGEIENILKKDPKYKMCIETMPKCRIKV